MSLMDLFRNAPSSDSNNNSSQNQPAPNPGSLGDSPPSTDSKGNMPGTDLNPVNPLDSYAKMFENAAKNSGIQAPVFKLDDKVVDEVSSKMDFTKAIPPETMQKAMSGDAQAFLSVIQATTQQAYKAAIQHSTSLTDTFMNQRAEYDQSRINSGVKEQLTTQAMSDAPNFDHPVIKQELNRVANQFAKANPDATPQEIAKASQKYISDLASALNPQAKPDPNLSSSGMDWSKYLSE